MGRAVGSILQYFVVTGAVYASMVLLPSAAWEDAQSACLASVLWSPWGLSFAASLQACKHGRVSALPISAWSAVLGVTVQQARFVDACTCVCGGH